MPEIALRHYDGVTALDAVGPYEVPAGLPDARARPQRPYDSGSLEEADADVRRCATEVLAGE